MVNLKRRIEMLEEEVLRRRIETSYRFFAGRTVTYFWLSFIPSTGLRSAIFTPLPRLGTGFRWSTCELRPKARCLKA